MTTVITDPASNRVQAMFLRAHVRLRIVGMKSKVSAAQLRLHCRRVTGKAYTNRTDWAVILRDLNTMINKK